MTLKYHSRGTCRPITTRQTVSGMDNSKPTGPHNHDQKIADATIARGEIRALAPYSHGSTALPITNSKTINSTKVSTTAVHPGVAANASSSGATAAMGAPK